MVCSRHARGTRQTTGSVAATPPLPTAPPNPSEEPNRLGPLALMPAYPFANAGGLFHASNGPNDALRWLVEGNLSFPFVTHAKYTLFCDEADRLRGRDTAEQGLARLLRTRYLASLGGCSSEEIATIAPEPASLRLNRSQWRKVCSTVLSDFTDDDRSPNRNTTGAAEQHRARTSWNSQIKYAAWAERKRR